MPARRTTALTAALTVAAPALVAVSLTTQPATADDTPGFSVRAIHVDTVVGPNNEEQCEIAADLYTPDGATAGSPAPAILTTHGFGGTKDDDKQTAVSTGFAKEGYVVLSYTGLGFGDSDCEINLDRPRWDGKAGKQLVDVLAGEKSYTDDNTDESRRVRNVATERPGDPRVGMIGGSYGGEIQYAIAKQDKRLDALIPLITWNDLSYSLAPNNTSFTRGVSYRTPGVAKEQWIDLFFGAGIIDGVDNSGVDPGYMPGTCPNFTDEACEAAAELNTLGYPDQDTRALADEASVATYIDQVKAPTLVVQGQADTLFNLQESVATYRGLRANGVPSALIWQSWGHSDGSPAPGELEFTTEGSIRDTYLGRRFLSWMDHYVRGRQSAPVGPQFEYFRDWVNYDTSPAKAGRAVAKAYAQHSSFSQAWNDRLFFSGPVGPDNIGRLVDRPKRVDAGSASYTNTPGQATSYSETSGLEGNGVNKPVSDQEGTFAAFTSPPLTRTTAIVGSPSLRLHLEAPSAESTQDNGPIGKLILFAKIYDVAPNGTPKLQHRLISPVRVTDVTKPVEIQLPGVVQRIREGHRIQLVVAASDNAYANNAAPQPVTVTTSKAKPSLLRLPLTVNARFR